MLRQLNARINESVQEIFSLTSRRGTGCVEEGRGANKPAAAAMLTLKRVCASNSIVNDLLVEVQNDIGCLYGFMEAVCDDQSPYGVR